jgi:hypothetical protein
MFTLEVVAVNCQGGEVLVQTESHEQLLEAGSCGSDLTDV